MESFRARSAAIQPPAPAARGDASERLVWIDWLKVIIVIGVFIYHCAEPFVLISWLVSNDERSLTLSAVAGFGYLFGMPLMFLLAGATAWLSLGRRSLRDFGLLRVQRLLIPLLLGILILTPLQWWLVAAIARGGENPIDTILWFFSGIHFDATPRWFGDYGLHLWFIAFLLAFSILSLPLLGLLRRPEGPRLLDWLAQLSTPSLLFVLFVPILVSQWLLRIPTPTYRDWADFALWLGFFLAGVILIADRRLLDRVVRNGPRLIALGLGVILVSLVVVGAFLLTGVIPPGQASSLARLEQAPGPDPASLAYITVRTVAGAALVGGSLWLGVRFFRRQTAWLPWASRAILPFYVLHHPITVAVAAVVVRWPLGVWPKFAVILVVSAIGSASATVLFMRSRIGRAVFGSAADGPPLARGVRHLEPADPHAVRAGEPLGAASLDGPASLIEALQASVAEHPDLEALRWKDGGRWLSLTYGELWSRIRSVSLGLQERGVVGGDHVVIVSRPRPEWVVADFAALALGAVVCPIYPGESDARIEEIARGLRPRLILVEDGRRRSRFGDIGPTVLMDAAADQMPGAMTLADLERSGAASEPAVIEAWASDPGGPHRSTVATIVQTIDEEGVARGAVLTHGNVLHNLVAARDTLPLQRGDVMLSMLPLSHMLERSAVLIALTRGATVAFAEARIDRWADNMREVRPHAMAAVPLFLTHLVRGLRAGSVDQQGVIGSLARWSLKIGAAARGESGLVGRRPAGLRLALADALVLTRLRATTGGRLRYLCCGGAPLSPEVSRFLSAIGVPVIEGYGMTETSPILTLNRLGRQRSGTVGAPVSGTELRIEAGTGEVLARGPQVMLRYHDLPQQTAATLLPDGWLRTGDLGAWDAEGNLRLTGVRKDLLVLATGKKVSPRPLETALEGSDLIARAALIDLGNEGLGALVWPDAEAIATHAALEGATHQELLVAELRRLLGGHASYERPRRLGILPRDLSVQDGELTVEGRRNRAVLVDHWARIATIPLSWRTREVAQVSVIPSPIGAVSSAG